MYEFIGGILGGATSLILGAIVIISFILLIIPKKEGKTPFISDRLLIIIVVVTLMFNIGMDNYAEDKVIVTKDCIYTDSYKPYAHTRPLEFGDKVSILVTSYTVKYGYGSTSKEWEIYSDSKDCNGTELTEPTELIK